MRKTFMAAAALALLGMTGAAQAVTLGGTVFNSILTSSTLELEAIVPGGNQPTNAPCLICGTSQPQQPTGFGYNNFKQGGGQSTINAFSDGTITNTNKGVELGDNIIGVGYTVGTGSIFRDFLEAGGGIGTHTFSVGLDANQTNANSPQTLESFYFLNLTQRTILASFTGGTTGNIAVANNGTGYPDYTITGFDLNRGDIFLGDTIAFFARITGANDGAESFFLIGEPNATTVPLPAGIWLFGGALAGLGALKARSRRQKKTFAVS